MSDPILKLVLTKVYSELEGHMGDVKAYADLLKGQFGNDTSKQVDEMEKAFLHFEDTTKRIKARDFLALVKEELAK